MAASVAVARSRGGMAVYATRPVFLLQLAAIAMLAAAFASFAAPAGGPAEPGQAADELTIDAAQQLMEGLERQLFQALERERSTLRQSPEEAYALVDGLLAPQFDRDYTARLVLGAHWRGASAEQRERFANALYRTLLRTYAGAVAEWTPEHLRLLPISDPPDARNVLVRTEVQKSGSTVVHVNYRLRRTDAGWKIFDVLVDGVSYVHNYYTDVNTEISQQGLDATIDRLEKRASAAIARAVRGPKPAGEPP
jgi:phospholipid transport system substrate-binding protein